MLAGIPQAYPGIFDGFPRPPVSAVASGFVSRMIRFPGVPVIKKPSRWRSIATDWGQHGSIYNSESSSTRCKNSSSNPFPTVSSHSPSDLGSILRILAKMRETVAEFSKSGVNSCSSW